MVLIKSVLATLALVESCSSAAAIADLKTGDIIPNSYIITLKTGTKHQILDAHLSWVADIHARSLSKRDTTGISLTYNGTHDFKGYAGSFDKDTIARIKKDPNVATVEPDRVWALDWMEGKPPKVATKESLSKRQRADPKNVITRKNAPWGLATVSHRESGHNDFVYDYNSGSVPQAGGGWVYIIDSGCRSTHKELEGFFRVEQAYTAYGKDHTDHMGHGTHVAGIIGGKEYGVSPNAHLRCVKVFDKGRAATSIVLGGFNWAVNDITKKGLQRTSVINMSLSGAKVDGFNRAVDAAYNAGILSIVAAGNDDKDIKDYSPASAQSALTIGAIDINWYRATYSNWGKWVYMFAPGTDVLSAWSGSDTDSLYLTGTSMAAPHVTGVAMNAISIFGMRGAADIRWFISFTTPTYKKVKGDLKGSNPLIVNNNSDNEKNGK